MSFNRLPSVLVVVGFIRLLVDQGQNQEIVEGQGQGSRHSRRLPEIKGPQLVHRGSEAIGTLLSLNHHHLHTNRQSTSTHCHFPLFPLLSTGHTITTRLHHSSTIPPSIPSRRPYQEEHRKDHSGQTGRGQARVLPPGTGHSRG